MFDCFGANFLRFETSPSPHSKMERGRTAAALNEASSLAAMLLKCCYGNPVAEPLSQACSKLRRPLGPVRSPYAGPAPRLDAKRAAMPGVKLRTGGHHAYSRDHGRPDFIAAV